MFRITTRTLYIALALAGICFAQDMDSAQAEEDGAVAAASCPVTDSLAANLKKPPKGLADRAFAEAGHTGVCADSLFAAVGEKHPNWKKFRKILPETQPAAMLRIYPVKKLTLDEQKRTFFSKALQDSGLCVLLADSVGLDLLSGKDWLKKTTPWDTAAFGCKHFLAPRVQPLIEAAYKDPAALRAKLLAVFPEIWFSLYADSSTDQEKVSYAINPGLLDSTNCRYADYDAAFLLKHRLPDNACRSYVMGRYGSQILRDAFRKTYKPAVIAQINKRLAAITPENINASAGLFDTLEVIVSDGETWEAVDSLQNSLLRLLAKIPQAIKQFQDPTADMMLTAINGNIALMCDYPDFNDRMLSKLVNDRIDDGKPMPTANELQVLQSCLSPELSSTLRQLLQQR